MPPKIISYTSPICRLEITREDVDAQGVFIFSKDIFNELESINYNSLSIEDEHKIVTKITGSLPSKTKYLNIDSCKNLKDIDMEIFSGLDLKRLRLPENKVLNFTYDLVLKLLPLNNSHLNNRISRTQNYILFVQNARKIGLTESLIRKYFDMMGTETLGSNPSIAAVIEKSTSEKIIEKLTLEEIMITLLNVHYYHFFGLGLYSKSDNDKVIIVKTFIKDLLEKHSKDNLSNTLYSVLSSATEEQKSKISSNIILIEILRVAYLNAINTKNKERIDFFSKILLDARSLPEDKARERSFQQVEQIFSYESFYNSHEEHKELDLAKNSAPEIMRNRIIIHINLPQFSTDSLKQIKEAIINPKIYLPALRQLDSAMRGELEKNGKLVEYEEYSRQASDKKTYCSIGNMNFVLNPNRFEHWNKNLRKVISEKLKKHGIKLIDENGEYVTFYGFVDNKIADNIVKNGTIFTDNQVSQGGLIHGKYTHAIQMYILACAIEDGKIQLPEGQNLKDAISDIVSKNLWINMFDSNDSSLESSYNANYRHCLDHTNLLQSNLMMLGNHPQGKDLSRLGDYLSDKFCCSTSKIREASKLELTPDQILLYQVCRNNIFNSVESFVTAEDYYKDKKEVVENKDGVVTKKMPETNTAEAQEPSNSPAEARTSAASSQNLTDHPL